MAESRNEEQAQRWQEVQLTRSRRGFLRGAGLRASVGAAVWLLSSEHAPEHESVSPPRGDLEHTRPASYQALLRDRAADLPWRQLPWWKRSIAEACTACMVCAQRCPTGALTVGDEPATRRIDFELGLCTACRLCERLCLEQALLTEQASSVGEVVGARVTLLSRPLHVCPSCHRPHVPGVDSSEPCAACKNERALKDEWFELLGRRGLSS